MNQTDVGYWTREGWHWTLQQFTTVCGKPWYALQVQTDAGVLRQWTGYRHEMDELSKKLGVEPEELPPTTEEEFFACFIFQDEYE